MEFRNLGKTLAEQLVSLKPVLSQPTEAAEYGSVTFGRGETDNRRWRALLEEYLQTAGHFEIHCWHEETQWINAALKYGTIKDTGWRCGEVIAGRVTAEFTDMLLSLPKPEDTEIYNKMTPFFSIFLDNGYSSSHYGTEVYVSLSNA